MALASTKRCRANRVEEGAEHPYSVRDNPP